MKPRRNLIGPQIRRLRDKLGWSQEQLATKLQVLGFNISRSGVAKIENGSQAVADYQAYYFMHVFNVDHADLAPSDFNPYAGNFHDRLTAFMHTDERGQRVGFFLDS